MSAFARYLLASLLVSLVFVAPAAADGVQEFEQSALNRTWYGAYQRPLASDMNRRVSGSDAERAARASDRAAAREARRAEARPPAVAAARSARDQRSAAPEQSGLPLRAPPSQTRVSPEPASVPAPVVSDVRPSPTSAIPEVRVGGFTPSLAAEYVRAVYALNETSLGDEGSIAAMYRHATEHGQVYFHTRPVVGDLVFFNNTHDANGDTRPNDFFSHVGLVEVVEQEGTITVLSYVDGRVRRLYMNLDDPRVERRDGRVINSRLRQSERSDLDNTAYLSGELFVGFASLLGSRSEVVVLDVWEP
ncbi:MAG: hypothetical protein ACI81R_000955 [Bradymonadia bacterium]|jgi:hypothetical protein